MEPKHKVAEILKNQADFQYYRDGNLYYSVSVFEENIWHKYTFPVDTTDTADIGNATFENKYTKGITLMRYFNKAVKANTLTVETNKYL